MKSALPKGLTVFRSLSFQFALTQFFLSFSTALAGTTVVATNVGDTFVFSSAPSSNFGLKTTLTVTKSSTLEKQMLLRFRVPKAALYGKSFSGARLTLYPWGSSSSSGRVYRVDPRWNERWVTYSTRPAYLPSGYLTFGEIVANTPVKLSVTGLSKPILNFDGYYYFSYSVQLLGGTNDFASKEYDLDPSSPTSPKLEIFLW